MSYLIPTETNLLEYKTECANKNDHIITVLVFGQVPTSKGSLIIFNSIKIFVDLWLFALLIFITYSILCM